MAGGWKDGDPTALPVRARPNQAGAGPEPVILFFSWAQIPICRKVLEGFQARAASPLRGAITPSQQKGTAAPAQLG